MNFCPLFNLNRLQIQQYLQLLLNQVTQCYLLKAVLYNNGHPTFYLMGLLKDLF